MKDETLASIGTILDKDMPRDAVHVAVVAMVAGTTIAPGDHVSIRGGLACPNYTREPGCVGIADPYLKGFVTPGERFWVFLYPGTITSLKHVWTHPVLDEPAKPKPKMSHADAENLLRNYAEQWGTYGFPELLEAVSHPDKDQRNIATQSISVQDWGDLADEEYEHFWTAVEIIMGESYDPLYRESVRFECCA